MKLSTLLLPALAPLSLATNCTTQDFDHDPLNISPATARRALTQLRTRDLQQVDTFLHILVAKSPEGEDWGPRLQSQLDFLNAHFEIWGYFFNVLLITYLIDELWASDIDVDKDNKMRTLHRGDYKTLNLYLVESAGGGVCSFPDGSGEPIDQQTLDFDGCFVPLEVGLSPTSGTLAHEIGHWFGLMHTFQGGCEGDGDYCDDTAPQNEPSSGHLATPGDLNSCPAEDQCGMGAANVKNFMDYTNCSQEFTPCQGGRMNVAWTQYRVDRAVAEGVQVKWIDED